MNIKVLSKFVLDQPQQLIRLDSAYPFRKNVLEVYLNDIPLILNKDYLEINTNTIKILKPTTKGDCIFVYNPGNIDNVIKEDLVEEKKKVSHDEDYVLKYYNASQNLMYNQQYVLKVKVGNISDEIKFSSKYSPLYSTVKIIRQDLLEIIDLIKDDDICFTIWENSLLANEISKDKIPEDKPSYAAKQFVRYKTEIDLIFAIYLAISGKAGSISKRLGNLTIEKTIKIPFLKDMLEELKNKLKEWEDMLRGMGKTGIKAKKAGKTNYPLPLRRGF